MGNEIFSGDLLAFSKEERCGMKYFLGEGWPVLSQKLKKNVYVLITETSGDIL